MKKNVKQEVKLIKKISEKPIVCGIGILLIASIIISALFSIRDKEIGKINNITNPELARAMEYPQVEEGDASFDNTPYVEFDAFFLRDLDGDGYAESVRGTCNEIGKQDTLYMELKLLTNGYIKEGATITINGNAGEDRNFYLETSIPEDNEIEGNYIGRDINQIKLKKIGGGGKGTQKILTGIVKSNRSSFFSDIAEALGNNIDNYSRENSITFKGIHVRDDGDGKTTEIPIEKTVKFNIDWYGDLKANIGIDYKSDIQKVIDKENNEVNIEFTIEPSERNNQLILSKSYVEGEIPQLNGYNPEKVEITGTDISYTYNPTTRKFTAQKEAVLNEKGNIVTTVVNTFKDNNYRYNSYRIKVTYTLEAYTTLGEEATIEYRLPIKGYYEGYNNSTGEFESPCKSNVVQDVFVMTFRKLTGSMARFDVQIGKGFYHPYTRSVISKEKPLKMYNGISEEEKEDYYTVSWVANIGVAENQKVIMKEPKTEEQSYISDQFLKKDNTSESMEDLCSFVGIYFGNPTYMLGENGEIKVFNDETGELLITFNKDNWNLYSNSNPYMYKIPVKHIRIETSNVNKNSKLSVYNIKEIDDEGIFNKYIKEDFDNLIKIESTLEGYLGDIENGLINKAIDFANYEAPISDTELDINTSVLSTQVTKKNVKITVRTFTNEYYNEKKWTNGIFLLKLPKEIIDLKINGVNVYGENISGGIFEQYKSIENGEEYIFIKIMIQNNIESSYTIYIDCDITPDPRIPTTTKLIELYAHNENYPNYYLKADDIYDINNNLNMQEQVEKKETSLSFVSPQSLTTTQIASNFNKDGNIAVAPQIAEIDKDQREATINISLANNYKSTISEIKVLIKIPREGNTYVINGTDLESKYDTYLQKGSIELSEQIKNVAKIYYTDKGDDLTKDIDDLANGWTENEPSDFKNVTALLIDLGSYSLQSKQLENIKYKISIPEGLKFNQSSYNHYAVYFSLDTENGKYRTYTEPNKLGFTVVKKFNLELTKYHAGKSKKVSGATYYIWEKGQSIGRTKVTDSEGKLELNELYLEKIYCIQEIASPIDYELNNNVIEFTTTQSNDGELLVQKISGEERGLKVIKEDGQDYKVSVEVEDEAKLRLKMVKKEKSSEKVLENVKYKITGDGISKDGKILVTNPQGIINLSGLTIGKEYTLEEVKAKGYYLADKPIRFKVINNSGNYENSILQGVVKSDKLEEEDCLPILCLEVEDEKIPRYNLTIQKVEKDNSGKLLSGAKFMVLKDGQQIGEYITQENGSFTLEDLYAFEESKNIEQNYVLKEVLPPVGYTKLKDIEFRALKNTDGTYSFEAENQAITKVEIVGNNITITLEDTPVFNLTKQEEDTGKLLPNTKFAIYSLDEGVQPARNSKNEIIGTKEIINGKEYYVVKTNAEGEITADLPQGLYKAVEVEAADEKYELGEIYFGIGMSEEAQYLYTIQDAQKLEAENANRISTSDGGSITAYEGNLIKYNKEGTIEWNYNNITEKDWDSHVEILEISNNNYIVASPDEKKCMIRRFNQEGDEVWHKDIIGNGDSNVNPHIEIISMVELSSNEIIAVGRYYVESITIDGFTLNSNSEKAFGGWNTSDVMIIKFDEEGNVKKAISLGGVQDEIVEQAILTDNESCIISIDFNSPEIKIGEETISNKGDYDTILVEVNQDLDIEWKTSIGKGGGDCIRSIRKTKDGGFIACGYFGSTNLAIGNNILPRAGGIDGMIIKYNDLNEVEWVQTVGGDEDDYINSVVETNDGNYIAVGNFKSKTINLPNGQVLVNENDIMSQDGIILKLNNKGEIKYGRTIIDKDDTLYFDGIELNSVSINDNNEIEVTGTNKVMYYGELKFPNGQVLEFEGPGYSSKIKFRLTYKEEEITNISSKKVSQVSKTNVIQMKFTKDEGYVALLNNEIIKYNKENRIEWKTQTHTEINISNKIIAQTSDEGYIVVSEPDNGKAIILTKIDNLGNIKWNKTIEVQGDIMQFEDIAEVDNNDYVLTMAYMNEMVIDKYRFEYIEGIYNSLIIRFDEDGNITWATTTKCDAVGNGCMASYVKSTSDGGYAVVMNAEATENRLPGRVYIDENDLECPGSSIVKFDRNNNIKWIAKIEDKTINAIELIANDEYIVEVSKGSEANIIKYNKFGEEEWTITETLQYGYTYGYLFSSNRVITLDDGGYLSVGKAGGECVTLSNYELYNKGLIIKKYNKDRELEWATSIEAIDLFSVKQNAEGSYLLALQDYEGAKIVRLVETKGQILDQEKILFENKIKRYNITTEVEKIDGVKGGEILGEGDNPYEIVKYNETNRLPIKITPNTGYEIAKVTINGKRVTNYERQDDGSYLLSAINNITENKHIVVTFVEIARKFVINKVDSEDETPLAGAKFRIEQVEEREIPSDRVGEIHSNGKDFYERKEPLDKNEVIGNIYNENSDFYVKKEVIGNIQTTSKDKDESREITEKIAIMQDNQEYEYWFVENEDGTITPNNTQVEGAEAYSTIEVDLIDKEEDVALSINSEMSVDGYSILYVSVYNEYNTFEKSIGITNSESPTYSNTIILPKGDKYYIGLNYNNYENGETENKCNLTLKYYYTKLSMNTFEYINSEYVPNNIGKKDTIASAYVEVDLEDYPESTSLFIDAIMTKDYFDDYGNNSSYGYVAVTQDMQELENPENADIYLTLTDETSYEISLEGGYKYYIHLGYYTDNSDSNDGFSVKIKRNVPIAFEEIDGKYIPNCNTEEWVQVNANIPINLTNIAEDEDIAVVINAQMLNNDESYARMVILDHPLTQISPDEDGIIEMCEAHEANEYVIGLKGGTEYYLNLEYYHRGNTNPDGVFMINSMELYKSTITTYDFETVEVNNEDGSLTKKYVSTNNGIDGSEASSYIPINLTDLEGKYNIVVNAQISSDKGDYGYAVITESAERPSVNYAKENGFIGISGKTSIVANPKSYTGVVQGGSEYFLHFIYSKDFSINDGSDKFTINSIKILPNADHLFKRELTTDELGQIITDLPYGQYSVTELEAPEGYEKSNTSEIVVIDESGEKSLTIQNTKKPKLIVHHYEKGTGINGIAPVKVAEDEEYIGTMGESYETKPKVGLGKYELSKNENGEFEIPSNWKGEYKQKVEEVTYYYEKEKIPLIVHHYIRDTFKQVPLANGNLAEDRITEGEEGQYYVTEPLKPSNDINEEDENNKLNEKYHLVEMPENASGDYEYLQVEVTYEYELNKYEITTKVRPHKEMQQIVTEEGQLQDVEVDVAGGSILGEGARPYEVVEHGESNTLEIKATPEKDYRVKTIEINGQKLQPDEYTVAENGEITLNTIHNIKENKEIVVEFEKITTQVIVHHYIYDEKNKEQTIQKVKLADGTDAPDQVIEGIIGDMYATKPLENLKEGYELYEEPNNSSGLMQKEVTHVNYYYTSRALINNNGITKDGTQVITAKDEEVCYKIKYTAEIKNYNGNAVITITDTLPYDIDEEKTYAIENALDGGSYSKENHTITWTEPIVIDTEQDGGTSLIQIEKNIIVVYANISLNEQDKEFTNKVKGRIYLDETEQTQETDEVAHTTQTNFVKDVKVVKTWEHGANMYERPSKLQILLKRADKPDNVIREAIIDDDSNWTYTFTNLQKYDEETGNEIQYIIEEKAVDGESLDYYRMQN